MFIIASSFISKLTLSNPCFLLRASFFLYISIVLCILTFINRSYISWTQYKVIVNYFSEPICIIVRPVFLLLYSFRSLIRAFHERMSNLLCEVRCPGLLILVANETYRTDLFSNFQIEMLF